MFLDQICMILVAVARSAHLISKVIALEWHMAQDRAGQDVVSFIWPRAIAHCALFHASLQHLQAAKRCMCLDVMSDTWLQNRVFSR